MIFDAASLAPILKESIDRALKSQAARDVFGAVQSGALDTFLDSVVDQYPGRKPLSDEETLLLKSEPFRFAYGACLGGLATRLVNDEAFLRTLAEHIVALSRASLT